MSQKEPSDVSDITHRKIFFSVVKELSEGSILYQPKDGEDDTFFNLPGNPFVVFEVPSGMWQLFKNQIAEDEASSADPRWTLVYLNVPGSAEASWCIVSSLNTTVLEWTEIPV